MGLSIANLGLDIIREVVGIVAGENLAARHRGLRGSAPHLLDVVLVIGVDDGRNIEVGLATPAREHDLSEHARLVLRALLDGVEVADVGVRELNSGLLGIAHSDGVDAVSILVRGEIDGSGLVVKGPESDGTSASKSSRADKGKDRGGEEHLEFGGCCWAWCRD